MYTGKPCPQGTRNHTWTNRLKFWQGFVNNWYTNAKQFPIVLMKQIVAYCDKTEQKTQKDINETKAILKKQLKKQDYEEIKNTITFSKTATKKLLQQRKLKNFSSVKHKRKSAVKTIANNNKEGSWTTEEQPRPTKPNYAQVLTLIYMCVCVWGGGGEGGNFTPP